MKAIILAGGKGKRLAPYTTILPKPLMPLGDMSIIEIVIRQLSYYGIKEITLAVGYLSELIMAFRSDGKKFGTTIHYSYEKEALGTAGPLSLVNKPSEAFLVMNGDILTSINLYYYLRYIRLAHVLRVGWWARDDTTGLVSPSRAHAFGGDALSNVMWQLRGAFCQHMSAQLVGISWN